MKISSRRTKFLLFTFLYIFGFLIVEFQKYFLNSWVVVMFITLVFIGNLAVLYPGYTFKDVFYISLQPFILTLGTLLGLIYFPNLNEYFKLALILVSAGLIYISTLTNNLLIAEKVEESSLPLFRVGIIWTQIILIIQSIPLITVIYKSNLWFVYQSFFIYIYFFFSSILYLHTILLFHKGERYEKREFLILAFQMSLVPFIGSLFTSFTSAESFLRATFITSLFMSMVGYIRGYIENTINNFLILQYSVISLIFLILLFLFN